MEAAKSISLVFEVMSSAPVCVKRQTTVGQLLELFDRFDYNAFPVTEDPDDALIGIVTKLDVLRALRADSGIVHPADRDAMATEVGAIMRPGVINLEGDTPIGIAADLMIETALRSLPIVHRGKQGRPRVVGIVSRGDLIRGLRFVMHREA